VLVSHHVEEVPPGFTHALMLRAGRVVAGGPLAEVMNAENLSSTFGMSLQLTVEEGRYAARRRAGRRLEG
jgi:iron complex transport system ATP-binding protein